jgi:hypothetical protein
MLIAGAYKGYEAKKLKEEEAQGYRDAAGRQMAITSREMAEEARNKELMHSRAITVAGMSGAGTEGLTKILGDLNAEGEYRVMSVLWNGQNEAEGLQYRAEAAEREGKAAQTAGIIDGITSAVSAYVGMGGGGPGGGKVAPGAESSAGHFAKYGGTPNVASGTMYTAIPGAGNVGKLVPGIPGTGLYSPIKPRVLWPQ